MADNPVQFRARAEAERIIAETSSLDNVRERAERSAKAWTKMAEQAEGALARRHERERAAMTGAAEVTP